MTVFYFPGGRAMAEASMRFVVDGEVFTRSGRMVKNDEAMTENPQFDLAKSDPLLLALRRGRQLSYGAAGGDLRTLTIPLTGSSRAIGRMLANC